MRSVLRIVSAGLLLSLAVSASANVIALYPMRSVKTLSVPELREDPSKNGQFDLRNVSVPTLEVFRPAANKANGAAVIVAPGGGFAMLVYVNEGEAVAKRLAQAGVTAFVLKYRLVQTPVEFAAMENQHMKTMDGVIARAASGVPAELPRFEGEDVATQDAAEAVKLVRQRSAEWGLNPRRIGFLGFSAGAMVAADVAIGDAAGRPDFVGLIYGSLRNPVPKNAPPAFIAAALDDPMLPDDAIPLFRAWRAAGRPAELHVYERGGHGFGMTSQGASSDHWFEEFVWWMHSCGLLK
jgi:acetyl esterase/lipase